MIIASWNLLNDMVVEKHAPQKDRLDEVIEKIQELMKIDSRIILYLCEVWEIENFEYIADKTGLIVVDQPCRYRTRYIEYMGFLCDKKTASLAQTERIMIDDANYEHDSVLKISVGKNTIVGLHLPVHVFKEFSLRKQFMQRVLEQKPDMFMGDFNATWFFPLRLKLRKLEYLEVHKNKRPKFPSPSYRGRNIHWWLPPISIDVQYFMPSSWKVIDSGYVLCEASDHPLIWSKVEYF